MENKWARKATEREREISVTLYHFFENFAKMTTETSISEGWEEMTREAVEIQKKYPECSDTIIGIMGDISRMAKEHSQNG
jgi:hypothetical protein